MPTLRTIANRHSALVSDNLRARAEQREAEQKRVADEAVSQARPYLDVLCEQITNEEIDRQLNGDPTILRSTTAEFPLPPEISAPFTAVMLTETFGEYGSMDSFTALAKRCDSPLYERLQDLTDANFRFQIIGSIAHQDAAFCIWPPH